MTGTYTSAVTATAAPEIGGLAFGGTWRHYQVLALDAFEDDRRHGRRRTHIVAPPGSGKTLLGVEIVRRLGARALVLVPNTAVQEQWVRAAARFGAPAGLAAADPSSPIACLTYQALCQLDDPAVALGNLAERRWAADRARATGTSAREAERDALGWTGAAAARRQREVARITASLKREIARALHGDLHLSELLSPGARRRIQALREGEVRTVVLGQPLGLRVQGPGQPGQFLVRRQGPLAHQGWRRHREVDRAEQRVVELALLRGQRVGRRRRQAHQVDVAEFLDRLPHDVTP